MIGNLHKLGILLTLFFVIIPILTFAQDNTVTVPDLVGLSVPEVAALLNKNGLRLGSANGELWTIASGAEPNVVTGQSVGAGQSLASGSVVDVTVLRPANILLIYDDNDFTVQNLTGSEINLTGLNFNALNGGPASLAATRWSATLREDQCVQVWSVNRNGPKDVEGCRFIQNWLVTTNSGEHFWTSLNGVTEFNVTLNGIERARCPAALEATQPITCEMYLALGPDPDGETPFIYFAYTSNSFAVINKSKNQWMPVSQTTLFNHNPSLSSPGLPLLLSDPLLFDNLNVVADLNRLAPNQCLLLTIEGTNTSPPEDCDVVAQRDLGAGIAFWVANFELDSITDGERRTCNAATAGKLTLCIMPR